MNSNGIFIQKYISIVLNEMGVVFNQQPHCILDTSDNNLPGGQWLPGAVLNVAECLLAAKPGRPDSSTAILYRNEGEDDLPVRKVTLGQLRANVRQDLSLPSRELSFNSIVLSFGSWSTMIFHTYHSMYGISITSFSIVVNAQR